jgi:putative aldouronate transport system permease protein
MAGEVMFYPVGFSLAGYEMLLEYKEIWTGYLNTIIYTFAGTIVSLLVTVPMGYMLSRKTLPFRKIINIFCILTMFISGGMIPTYLLIKGMGLTDTRFLMIVLGSANVWNMILCRNFFESNIPDGIIEAAKIDGCTELGIFSRIVLPLSKVILAVMTLYFGVAHWNSYYNALIYLQDQDKWPLQLVIRDILNSSNIDAENIANAMEQFKNIESMKYGLLVVATLPMLILYPFVQKYFVQGVMIGSVKE